MNPNQLNELKQIHFKETGEMISDQEALEMGIRLKQLLDVILKPIPEETVE